MTRKKRFTGTTSRERRYNATRSMRAIVAGILVAPALIALASWLLVSKPAPHPQRQGWSAVPEFSSYGSPAELTKAFKDTGIAADTSFLERDKVEKMLARIKKDYAAGMVSKAELDQALVDFTASLNDRYARVMGAEEYRDLMVRLNGQEVGIELSFNVDSNTDTWMVNQVPANGPAQRAGVQTGDVVIQCETYHIEQLKKIGNPGQLLGILLNRGTLGSKARLTVRRGADVYDFDIERTIMRTTPAVVITDFNNHMDPEMMMMMEEMGGSFGVDGGAILKISHMEGAQFIAEFERAIDKLNADGIAGIALDLSEVIGGTGDTAIRIAAQFIESGVICHSIRPVGKDGIEMKTYIAENGKVTVKTSGPFRKSKDGKLIREANAQEKVETLPWRSGVYKGEVVVGVSDSTIGSAEVIAAALQKTRHSMVVGTDITFGKGMSQTYFPVSPEHWVRFTTSVYLQPDGASIEKRGVTPNIPAQQGGLIMTLGRVLENRLQIVPYPTGPGVKKDGEMPEVKPVNDGLYRSIK